MTRSSMERELSDQLHVKRRAQNIKRLTDSILDKDWDKLTHADTEDLKVVQAKLASLIERYKYVGFGT